VRDLPDDLNAESKLVLVRRLLREGLLKMCGPPPSAVLPPFLMRPVADDIARAGEVEEAQTTLTNDWDALEPAQQMQQIRTL
jgi:hypothetical protein